MKNPFLALALLFLVAGVYAAGNVVNLSYAWVLIGTGLVFMTFGLFQFKGRRRKSGPS